MKTYYILLILTFILIRCYMLPEHEEILYKEYVEIENTLYHFPLRIANFECMCIDTNFQTSMSRPPHKIKKIKDFDFQVMITVRVDSRYADWDDVFFVEIEFVGSRHEQQILTFNVDSSKMYSKELYCFPLTLYCLNGDRLIFRLGLKEYEKDKIVFVHQDDVFRVVDAFF